MLNILHALEVTIKIKYWEQTKIFVKVRFFKAWKKAREYMFWLHNNTHFWNKILMKSYQIF